MKKRFIVLILVLAVFSLLVGVALLNRHKKEGSAAPPKECPVSSKEMIVQGSSMYPYIVPNENVRALFGYYDCHPIQRGDVILYDYSGDKNLLIKFVRGIPGDKWSLKENSGSYEIMVNGSPLVNSEGKPYLIGSYKMLELYAESYPTIPEDTYLLLGDETSGSLDSTRFGLVGKKDIMAKVILSR